ncbi:hypothetical protein [Bradyrhizobium sp. USDA 4502]
MADNVLFNPAGEKQINLVTANGQFNSDTAALLNGGYVTTYTSFTGGANGDDIFFQRLASDGTPIGSAVLISTLPNAEQNDSAVAARPDNGAIVVYDDNNGFPATYVRYASVSSTGVIEHTSFFDFNAAVNISHPDIAEFGSASTKYLIAQQADVTGTNSNIRFEVYDSSTDTFTTLPTNLTTLAGAETAPAVAGQCHPRTCRLGRQQQLDDRARYSRRIRNPDRQYERRIYDCRHS